MNTDQRWLMQECEKRPYLNTTARWLEDHGLQGTLEILAKFGSSLGHMRDGDPEDLQQVIGGDNLFSLDVISKLGQCCYVEVLPLKHS